MALRGRPSLLPDLLRAAAERGPEAQALRCAGGGLTYEELELAARRMAAALRRRGVCRGDRVGIYLEKSLEAVTAIYGAMMAGAAYVPIDPFAPASRVAFLIEDCGIRHLVSGKSRRARLRKVVASVPTLECVLGIGPDSGLPVRSLSWQEVDECEPADGAQPASSAEDLAYVLYTSGSTGQPKGVMHSHRSALAFVEWAVSEFGVRGEDRLSSHAPFHFDLSIFDLYAAAASSAATVLIPEDVARLIASLGDLLEEERVSIWYSVPFALIQLLQRGGLAERDLSSLRTVLFAGEPFPPKHLWALMRLLPQVDFYNLYGPTETNVCTFYPMPPLSGAAGSELEPIPIGRACAGAELLVVDSDDRPVAAGEAGELLVSGPTTMLGYWRRPERTRRAFWRANGDAASPAFYRTGDSVRLETSGDYHFLGRQDRQVKLRGFRIELDEIEIALLAHPEVEEAAVYLVRQEGGESVLEAAVVSSSGSSLTQRSLVRHLSELLPRHSIPQSVLVSASFPRTSTGKLDRQELEARASTAYAEGGVRE